MRLLIFSFITRDSSGGQSQQGTDILLFRPQTGGGVRNLTFTNLYTYTEPLKDKSPLLAALKPKEPSPEQLSKLSVESATGLLCSPDAELRPVRKSKRLQWDDDVFIEAYLYRLAPPAELHFEIYRTCLGSAEDHSWLALGPVLANTESEQVSTALNSVILPPSFASTFDSLHADALSLPEGKFVILALSLLHQAIRTKSGRQGFKFYPLRLPSPPYKQTKEAIEDWLKKQSATAKANIFAYWTNVLCHHIRAAHNSTALTYWLTRCLASIKPFVTNPEIDLEMLEVLSTKAIHLESERHEAMIAKQSNESVTKLLRIKINREDTPLDTSTLTVNVGSMSASVLRIVSGMIKQVLQPDPLSVELGPSSLLGASPGLKALHILIPESRPNFEGVQIASTLFTLITECKQQQAARSTLQEDQYSSLVTPNLQGLTSSNSQALQKYNLLQESLLHQKSAQNKVTLELTTDNGAASAIFKAAREKQAQVVLLGTEAVLPDANVISRAGACAIAHAGSMVQAPVFAIARLESVQLEPNIASIMQLGEPRELLPAWLQNDHDRSRQAFIHRSTPIDQPILRLTNPKFEIVPADLIDGYLTESGLLDVGAIRASVEMGRESARMVWS